MQTAVSDYRPTLDENLQKIESICAWANSGFLLDARQINVQYFLDIAQDVCHAESTIPQLNDLSQMARRSLSKRSLTILLTAIGKIQYCQMDHSRLSQFRHCFEIIQGYTSE